MSRSLPFPVVFGESEPVHVRAPTTLESNVQLSDLVVLVGVEADQIDETGGENAKGVPVVKTSAWPVVA